MEKRKLGCKCITWARTFDEELLSIHAPSCKNRNIEVEAKLHIAKLIEALEYEGKQGDGINEDYYNIYQSGEYRDLLWISDRGFIVI